MPLFTWKHYKELTKEELHEILALRQKVFIVEQECAYLDADQLDHDAFHLFSKDNSSNTINSYLRVIKPGVIYQECAIGRVLTSKQARGEGLGIAIVDEALKQIAKTFPKHNIQISAQLYLEIFYKNLGFTTTSQPYDEDGIQHIKMKKTAYLI